ncbi:MAG: hypothetical protein WB439_03845 [Acidobacteriaceae bacterium]
MDPIPSDGETTRNESGDELEELLLKHARSGACPPPDLLFAAEEGVLPEQAGVSIREHVAHCALCRTLLAEPVPATMDLDPGANARIRAKIQIGIDDRTSARRAVSKRRPIFRLSFAFGAVVVVIGLLSILGYRQWRFHKSQTVAVNHPQVTTPAIPADTRELHQIAALAPPEDVAALVMRGSSSTPGPTVEDLLPAFRAYNRGDYAQAATAFAPLVARFPQSDIPPLYLGVSRLELGQNADAQRALAQAYSLTGSAHHDAAAWYLAVADLRLNRLKIAVPLLRALCAQPGDPDAPRACALAQRLGAS